MTLPSVSGSDAPPDRTTDDTDIDHPWVATLYEALTPIEWLFRPHREYLAADLSGRVLDLGAGTGRMFEPVLEATAAGDSADDNSGPVEYHAIEPDPNMRRRATRCARDIGMAVDLRDARAEALPYPDDSFDVVLSSVVFCTIQDPDAALEEVARVLRPDGEFRFFEHVRADGWRERGQNLCNPAWKRVAGGCNLNRATVERFVGHDAFDVIEVERLSMGIFPATPFVRGLLRRRR